MDAAVSDLHEIDMAGERRLGGEGNGKSQFPLHVHDILWCEVDRHFDGHGDRIGRKHEALQGLMPPGVVGHGLQNEAGNARCEVLFLRDFHTRQIEGTRVG
jgi:hypothetical protein